MTLKRSLATLLMAAGSISLATVLLAQGTEKFSARLGWVPISGAERAGVAGKGSASASLAGRALSITGSFEGLAAPATIARLHDGIAKGARGPAISDLMITKATAGTISGAVMLTPEQVDNLRKGRLYVQVHSEKGVAPDGSNLWGWLSR